MHPRPDTSLLVAASRARAEAGAHEEASRSLAVEARVAAAAGHLADAGELAAAAASLTTDVARRAELLDQASRFALAAGDQAAADHARAAIEHATEAGDDLLLARALHQLWRATTSDDPDAVRALERGAGLPPAPWTHVCRAQLHALAARWLDTHQAASAAVDDAGSVDDMRCAAAALGLRALASAGLGDAVAALADESRAASLMDAFGMSLEAARLRTNMALSQIELLRTADAVRHGEQVLLLTGSGSPPAAAAQATLCAIWAHAAAGDLRRAAELLDGSPDDPDLPAIERCGLALARAVVLADVGAGPAVDDALETASRLLGAFGHTSWLTELELARIQHRWAGDADASALDAALDISDDEPLTRMLVLAWIARRAACAGDLTLLAQLPTELGAADAPDASPLEQLLAREVATLAAVASSPSVPQTAQLKSIAEAWSTAGRRLDGARTRAALGAILLARSARTTDAVALLVDAEQELAACGAAADLQQVMTLLATSRPTATATPVDDVAHVAEAAIDGRGSTCTVDAGTLAPDDVDGARVALAIVRSGSVQLTRIGADGRRLALRIADAGELIAMPQPPAAASVTQHDGVVLEALTDATVVLLHAQHVRDCIASSPEAALLLAQQLAQQVSDTGELAEHVAFLAVDRRLAHLLIRLARRWGHPTLSGGVIVNRTFTHEQLAEMVGSSRKSITLLLGDYRRAGLIEMRKRRVVVLDEPGLQRLVDGHGTDAEAA